LKKIIFLSLLLLFFLDVYDTHKYIGILLGLYILLWFPNEILKVRSPELILILFGLTYVIFVSFNLRISVQIITSFTLLPLIIFKIGMLSIRLFKTEKNIFLISSLSLLALSFLIVYSILSSYLKDGIIGSRTPEIRFIRRSEDVSEINATLVGLRIVPLLVFLPLFLFQRNGALSKYFFAGSFLSISAIIVASLVASRAPILILAVLFLLHFYYGFKYVKYLRKVEVFSLFLLLIFAVSVGDFGNFELTSFLYERMLLDDLSQAGFRIDMWLLGLENTFKYPLGGERIYINYFHNLWLDLRHEAGVVPMIFLILLSFHFTYCCWRVINSVFFSIQFKSFFGSVYLSVLLMMFTEPVIKGSFVFFMYFIFIGGVLFALKNAQLKNVENFRYR
jgi:hypothetical protein